MKKIHLTFIVIFLTLIGRSQSLEYVGTKTIQNNLISSSTVIRTTIDNQYSVISVGNFTGTTDFDPTASNYSLTCPNTNGGFIQKLDNNGNLIWAKQIETTGNFFPNDIKSFDNGEFFIVGYFSQTIDCDPGSGVVSFTSGSSNNNSVVMKFDSDGNLLWAKQFYSTTNSLGYNLSLDPITGNVAVVGIFNGGTIDVDPSANSEIVNSFGGIDPIVIIIDPNGNYIRNFHFGATGLDIVKEAFFDPSGNLFLAGYFAGTVDFDPSVGTNFLTAVAQTDGCIVKYNPDGTLAWVRQFAGTDYDYCFGVKTDWQGRIVVTGLVNSGTIDLNPGVAIANFSNLNTSAMYMVLLDANGDYIKHGALEGGSTEYTGWVINPDQKIIFSGKYSNTVDFDPSIATNYVSATNGQAGEFILVLDDNLDFLSVDVRNEIGVNGISNGPLSISNRGSLIYSSGNFAPMLDMDPGVNVDNFSSVGPRDFYISKFKLCTEEITNYEVSACEAYFWEGTTYTESGTYVNNFTTQHGCDSLLYLNLTINANPEIPQVVNIGNATLSTTATSGIQWIDCNTINPILGETGQTLVAEINGSYGVIVTSTEGCIATSNCVEILDVGIEEFSKGMFEVYPNPFTSSTKIHFTKNITENKVALLDASGKQIKVFEIIDNEVIIMNEGWQPGIYFLSFINDQHHTIIQKLIIQ